MLFLQDGYRRRAACICVRSNSEAEVLLVTSSRRPELWIVPGGGVSILNRLVSKDYRSVFLRSTNGLDHPSNILKFCSK